MTKKTKRKKESVKNIQFTISQFNSTHGERNLGNRPLKTVHYSKTYLYLCVNILNMPHQNKLWLHIDINGKLSVIRLAYLIISQ